jgi:uncharacterized small protein (DUF1192 family)
VEEEAMDWDEMKPKPKAVITVGENLENLSLAELEARLVALSEEIERVRGEITAKKAHEAAASAFFKR